LSPRSPCNSRRKRRGAARRCHALAPRRAAITTLPAVIATAPAHTRIHTKRLVVEPAPRHARSHRIQLSSCRGCARAQHLIGRAGPQIAEEVAELRCRSLANNQTTETYSTNCAREASASDGGRCRGSRQLLADGAAAFGLFLIASHGSVCAESGKAVVNVHCHARRLAACIHALAGNVHLLGRSRWAWQSRTEFLHLRAFENKVHRHGPPLVHSEICSMHHG